MVNMICYICNDNLIYKADINAKYLDEEGNKPCFECLLEAGAFDEEEAEERVQIGYS